MANKLYREEALQYQNERLLGDVMLSSPVSFSTLTLVAVGLATLVLLYGFYGEYTRKAHVSGYLAPSVGSLKVYAPEPGLLVEKTVTEGQHVRKGDKLFVLSTERRSPQTVETRAAAIALLKQRRDSLIEELRKQQIVDKIEAASTQQAIRGRQEELARLRSEILIQREKLASAESSLQRYRKLAEKKFVAEVQVHEKLDLLLSEKGKLESMLRQQLELQRELNGLQSQATANELKVDNHTAAMQRDIAALEQDLTEHESRRTIVITAPVDGKATTILADVGQSASTTAPLLTILPKDAVLEAHLLVPSRAIGFIAAEQSVSVRYQAFPYQRFGSHHGRIKEISKTLITPSDGNNLPLSLQEPVYRVIAILDAQRIKAYGNDMPLQSGMVLDADVWLDHRRLVEWLLEPLFSISGRV